jgi:Family of unknown function (DUF5670)
LKILQRERPNLPRPTLVAAAETRHGLARKMRRQGQRRGVGARRVSVLETIIVLFVLLWLLGMVSSYTLGGLIHVLLVLAVVVTLVRIIQGRQVV